MKDKSYKKPSQAKRGYILRGKSKEIFILVLLFFTLFKVEFAQHRPLRIIDLKIVADENFRQNQGWGSRTKQLVADSDLNEKVQFIKRMPYEELMSYTIKADLGISLEENLGLNYYYALPNKLFDYLVLLTILS